MRAGVLAVFVASVLSACAEALPPLTHPVFTDEQWEQDDAECSRSATLVRDPGSFLTRILGRNDIENQRYYRCMVTRGYRPTIREDARSAAPPKPARGAVPTGVGGTAEPVEATGTVVPSTLPKSTEAGETGEDARSVVEPGATAGGREEHEPAAAGEAAELPESSGEPGSSGSAEPSESVSAAPPESAEPLAPLRWLDVPLEP